MASRWQRSAAIRALEQGERLLLVDASGAVREVSGASAELARAVLEILTEPRTAAEVREAVADLVGAPLERPAVVDELLALLADTGAIREVATAARPASPAQGIPRPARVVLGVTGAIATLHAPALVLALQRRGFVVRVAATRAARRFLSVPGVEALTHHRVVRSMWSRDPSTPVPHLELAAWADVIVICPASATTLARLAAGAHDELVAAMALAARVPVILAPSMNPAMLAEGVVQRNLAQLREAGFYLVPAAAGAEVADAPEARTPVAGGAPPAETMADLVTAVWRTSGTAARARAEPVTAAEWDARHAARPAEDPATLVVDDDLATVLAAHAGAAAAGRTQGLLLDVGTGAGAFAVHAARAGFTVVATEISSVALDRAHAHGGGLPITFLLDDITESRLAGGFRVAVDRGCLHHLPAAAQPRWAHTMIRLVAPGGLLLVKTDAPGAPAARATHRFDGAAIAALLAPGFTLVETRAGTWPAGKEGGGREPIPATVAVLRRA